MAVELIAKCFKTPYPPAPKIVLIALCDFSNDKGMCFPSLRTLCQSCTISCSNINYILNTFVVIKLIHREKRKRENGSNTSSLIYINIKKLNMVANSEDKKKFLEEYLTAYRQETQPKKPTIGQAKNQSLDKGQNQSLDKLIQSIGQLEPSINRQEEISKDISSLSSREYFLKSFLDFIDDIRKLYRGDGSRDFYPTLFIHKGEEIGVNGMGYLYIKGKAENLSVSQAQALWKIIYNNQAQIIPLPTQHSQEVV